MFGFASKTELTFDSQEPNKCQPEVKIEKSDKDAEEVETESVDS